MTPPRVVIAAGGTGGHLFPALALALEFKSRNVRILVIGKTTKVLKDEFDKAGIEFRDMPVVRIPEKKPGLILFPFRAGRAFLSALLFLLRFRPSAVIGMGGYASASPAAAATLLRIPLYFCEQNLLPGKVTRAFSRFSSAVFTSFPDSSRYLRTKRALEFGNPLRPLGENNAKITARQKLNLDEHKFTVLALGGSQGAHRINLNVIANLNRLSPREIQFIHLTGSGDLESVSKAYRENGFQNYTRDFFSEMGLLYAAADLVICRSGATTIAELNLFGLPSILIPYPFAAEDHQRLNAAYLVRCGAAVLREESSLNEELLALEIKALAGDNHKLRLMSDASRRISHPEPAKSIVDFILSNLHYSSANTSA